MDGASAAARPYNRPMNNSATLRQVWRDIWVLSKAPPPAAWRRVLLVSGAAILTGAVLMAISGVLTGRESDLGWWRASFIFNMMMSLLMANGIVLLAWLLERVLPERALAWLNAIQDWRAMCAINALLLAGVTLGSLVGMLVAGFVYDFDALAVIGDNPLVQARFYIMDGVVSVAAWGWWLLRRLQQERQRALQLMANEAQLRLLQGQIEPHFLFNTLANIESLMDSDPACARAMLEAFTDYLRAGLSQMRLGDTTLGAELEMGQRYLELMRIRMGQRLDFHIEADADVRAIALPALLLQPLVENAIQHGLEPKLEGGQVRVTARAEGGQLRLQVRDNGLGSAAARQPRRGNGVATANLRGRLQARYGNAASLNLYLHADGASAEITLPTP
jgi:signal transduction histidine kinase